MAVDDREEVGPTVSTFGISESVKPLTPKTVKLPNNVPPARGK
ncbi:MAG: hypothetical protein WD231_01295 [Candidatus Woykebacteria bacterium]